MKNFNRLWEDEKQLSIIYNYILDNSEIFKDKFKKKYEFICDYPFVLKFPMEKLVPSKYCDCCGHKIEQEKYWMTWEDGYRPNIDDISISLNTVVQVINMSKINCYDLNEEIGEFVSNFKMVF